MKNEMIMLKKKFCLITTNEKNNVYIVYIMCSVPHITSNNRKLLVWCFVK